MMSAVTTASSVCGCRTTRRTTTTPRMTKPATMARPIDLPSTPRGSRILAPEQDEPGGEDQQAGQARIHEAGRAEVRGHVDRDEQLSDDDREHDADDDRDQPCREEGPQDVDGRRHPATGKGDEAGGGQRADRPPDRGKRGCHARPSLRIPSVRQTHSSGSETFLRQHGTSRSSPPSCPLVRNPGPTGQDAASVREPCLAGGRRVRLAGAVLIPESPHPHLPRFPSGTPISSGAYIQTATDWQAAMAA